MTRTDDCRRLAKVMGWECVHEDEADTTSLPWEDDRHSGVFRVVYPGVGANEVEGFPQTMDVEDLIYIPLPDAPLHEHMEFVGRIAEAMGAVGVETFYSRGSMLSTGSVRFAMEGRGWTRDMTRRIEDHTDDLSWAAVRAALAAKGGTDGRA